MALPVLPLLPQGGDIHQEGQKSTRGRLPSAGCRGCTLGTPEQESGLGEGVWVGAGQREEGEKSSRPSRRKALSFPSETTLSELKKIKNGFYESERLF